jgi:hypothetical protein
LSLDDLVQKHIPELRADDRPVTLRHLLHHTSGLRDYTTLMDLAGMPVENFYLEDQLLDLILRQKVLNYEPGEAYLYSNSGYFLLGVIARRLTGNSIVELIREIILEPLGMQATDFNDDTRRIVKNRALGYSPKEGGGFVTDISFCGGFGDGAVLSTVEDLFLWDQNFYHNRLAGGGQELIQQMLSVGTLNNGESLEYAFGLVAGSYRGLRTVSHGGGWAGYRSELLRFPDQKFSVICLANLGSISPVKLARQVADLCLVDEFTQPVAAGGIELVALPDEMVESLPGYYQSQKSYNLLELCAQEGKLFGEIFGQRFQLAAAGPACLSAVDASDDIEIELEEPISDKPATIRVRVDESKPERYQKMTVAPFDPAHLPDYVGDYFSDELNATYAVMLEGGQTFLKRGAAPKETLKPVSQEVFQCRDLELHFAADTQERITAFDLVTDRVRNIRFTRKAIRHT